jgi:hypothetical protein
VGGIFFANYVHQSKDGFNDVHMFIMMGDLVEEQMCDILVQRARKFTLNITKASPGEILPQGNFHNYVGFLLKDNKHVV